MGRAARVLRQQRQAEHRSARRWRRTGYVISGLAVAIAIVMMIIMAMFCIEAARHPWWTRTAAVHAG